MKSTLPRADREKAMKALAPLGPLRSRALTSVMFATRMHGMPEGPYALPHCDTVFKNKDRTTATVILTREADHAWRGAGYLIK